MNTKNGLNNEEVGKRIRKLRETNRLTQEQLAEILKVSPNAVRDYERGKYGISKNVMLIFKKHFCISIDCLLFGESTDQKEILPLIVNMEDEDKMRILLYLCAYFVNGKEKGTVKNIDLKKIVEDLIRFGEEEL